MEVSKEFYEQVGYYVYLLVDPRDNKVFYVGKGHNDRVNQHEAEALAGKDSCNSEKIAKINEITDSNNQVKQIIVRWGMTEEEAFCVEAALIDFISSGIQLGHLTNMVSGHGSHCYGLQTPEQLDEKLTRGDLDVENLQDNILCINVNKRRKEGNLYEAIRGNWNISPKQANKTDYVIAEYGGVIIGVFKTDEKGWYEVAPEEGKEDVNRKWCRFDGEEVKDPAVLDRYIHKRLPEKKKGSSNPVRYFNKKG